MSWQAIVMKCPSNKEKYKNEALFLVNLHAKSLTKRPKNMQNTLHFALKCRSKHLLFFMPIIEMSLLFAHFFNNTWSHLLITFLNFFPIWNNQLYWTPLCIQIQNSLDNIQPPVLPATQPRIRFTAVITIKKGCFTDQILMQ